LLLSAGPDARASFPLRVQGAAQVGGSRLMREVRTEERLSVVSVAPPPELLVAADAARVTLEAGGQAVISVKIDRQRGFAGRVPIDVRNLPPGVVVKDVGLNGVLITEAETAQKFILEAQPWVQPMELPIYLVGVIETTSPQPSVVAAQPLILSIKAKESAASVRPK